MQMHAVERLDDYVVLIPAYNIEHTFVDESMRNQGIAKKLLDKAADYARENQYKMEPVCSYTVVAFDRYKEYDDVKV
ncbi:N-acetyltransferase [Latilactobacillus sakei]|uniref:GNAT family N-acetyltransferase n=1 Tax=Latilactobacillus sakei TaxID=1599 RepID=UPI001F4BE81D|nr:GNAT family N-acetyltransferase [Latilactobacillus sakei]UNC20389.1 N-acetyltransferase [Latilactobacillus sakei]